jgi:hypothetical protein
LKRTTEKESRTFYFACDSENDLEEWAIYLEFAKAKVTTSTTTTMLGNLY